MNDSKKYYTVISIELAGFGFLIWVILFIELPLLFKVLGVFLLLSLFVYSLKVSFVVNKNGVVVNKIYKSQFYSWKEIHLSKYHLPTGTGGPASVVLYLKNKKVAIPSGSNTKGTKKLIKYLLNNSIKVNSNFKNGTRLVNKIKMDNKERVS